MTWIVASSITLLAFLSIGTHGLEISKEDLENVCSTLSQLLANGTQRNEAAALIRAQYLEPELGLLQRVPSEKSKKADKSEKEGSPKSYGDYYKPPSSYYPEGSSYGKPDSYYPESSYYAKPDSYYPESSYYAKPDSYYPESSYYTKPDSYYPESNYYAKPDSYYPESNYYAKPDSYYPESNYYDKPDSYYPESSYYAKPDSYYPESSYYAKPDSYYAKPDSYYPESSYYNKPDSYYPESSYYAKPDSYYPESSYYAKPNNYYNDDYPSSSSYGDNYYPSSGYGYYGRSGDSKVDDEKTDRQARPPKVQQGGRPVGPPPAKVQGAAQVAPEGPPRGPAQGKLNRDSGPQRSFPVVNREMEFDQLIEFFDQLVTTLIESSDEFPAGTTVEVHIDCSKIPFPQSISSDDQEAIGKLRTLIESADSNTE